MRLEDDCVLTGGSAHISAAAPASYWLTTNSSFSLRDFHIHVHRERRPLRGNHIQRASNGVQKFTSAIAPAVIRFSCIWWTAAGRTDLYTPRERGRERESLMSASRHVANDMNRHRCWSSCITRLRPPSWLTLSRALRRDQSHRPEFDPLAQIYLNVLQWF